MPASEAVVLPETSRPVKYRITLQPDLRNFTFKGEQSVDILVLEPTSTIVLNAIELEITSIALHANGTTLWRRDYSNAIVVVNPNSNSSPKWTDMPPIAAWDAYIGAQQTVGVGDDPGLGPRAVNLRAQPNPFAARTVLSFELSAAAWVRIKVFDVRGRMVGMLYDGAIEAGPHEITLNAVDFPAPFGPMTHTISPSFTSRDTS